MSEEKKNEVTEKSKEARKLSEEELEQVSGGRETIVFESPVIGVSGGGLGVPFAESSGVIREKEERLR